MAGRIYEYIGWGLNKRKKGRKNRYIVERMREWKDGPTDRRSNGVDKCTSIVRVSLTGVL